MTIAAGAEVIEGGVEDLCTGTFIVAFSQTDDPRSRHAYVTVADEGACVQSSTAW
ncbi:hypothetical protein SAMN05880545_1045 [Microbacterium sp. RU33B]|nr:hypothetical protein SAMN05880545_1045 [Microbacterium sp. RU33B]